MDNKFLFIKSIFTSLTDEERQSLDEWRRQSGHCETIDTVRRFLTEKISPVEFMGNINVGQGLKRVYAKAGHRKARIYRLVAGTAAGVAAAALIAFLVMPRNAVQTEPQGQRQSQFVCLQTSSGETVEITNDSLDFKASTLDSLLRKSKTIGNGAQNLRKREVKLIVPRGKTIALTLDDGTCLKLNALSSLAFATPFVGGNARDVHLTGEAFFNVAKNKKCPFVVHTGLHDVVVTGTVFNVKAYKGETFTTTLCEGSVKVTSKTHADINLKPGQQLTSTPDGTISVEYVDTGYYTAWIDGVYNFDGQSLDEVMQTLRRWYDIDDVVYGNNGLQNRRFSGRLRKKDGLESILKVISEGTHAKISYEKRNVKIK